MVGIYRADVEASSPRSRGLPPLRRISLTPLVLLLAGALLASGCATESTGDRLVEGLEASSRRDPATDRRADRPGHGPRRRGGADERRGRRGGARRRATSFWSRTYEDLYGEPYEPIGGGFWPVRARHRAAAVRQPAAHLRRHRRERLLLPVGRPHRLGRRQPRARPLRRRSAGFTLGIVFAHEFGHAIQKRAGTRQGPTIMSELQADCFAGAWTADVEAGNSEYFELDRHRPRQGDRGLPRAPRRRRHRRRGRCRPRHGLRPHRRVRRGLRAGRRSGAPSTPTSSPPATSSSSRCPSPTRPTSTAGGNLPLDELGPILLADLEDFWTLLFQEQGKTWTPVADVVTVDPSVDEVACGDQTFSGDELVGASFYCIDSDTIYVDGVNTHPRPLRDRRLRRRHRDRSPVRLRGPGAARQPRQHAGHQPPGRLLRRPLRLQRVRRRPRAAGAGAVPVPRRPRRGRHRVPAATAMPATRSSDGDASVGTAFQRFDAYRAGFLEGTAACDALLAEG